VDLTWSYASALTAFDARANVPVDGLIVPTVCGTNPGPTSTLTFQVFAETIFGGRSSLILLTSYQTIFLMFTAENIFVTGNMDVIGHGTQARRSLSLRQTTPPGRALSPSLQIRSSSTSTSRSTGRISFESRTPTVKRRPRPRVRGYQVQYPECGCCGTWSALLCLHRSIIFRLSVGNSGFHFRSTSLFCP